VPRRVNVVNGNGEVEGRHRCGGHLRTLLRIKQDR
jgi:hypothetical protein